MAPVRTVLAPDDPNAFWDPWGVTFDSSGHLYVPPVRTFQLGERWNPWPSDLAVDSHNELLAAVIGPQGNGIKVYTGGAHGSNKPVRVTSITGITSSQCDGTIYAMVHASSSGFGPGRIDAYTQTAHGNARPLRVFTDRHSNFTDARGLTITKCEAS